VEQASRKRGGCQAKKITRRHVEGGELNVSFGGGRNRSTQDGAQPKQRKTQPMNLLMKGEGRKKPCVAI